MSLKDNEIYIFAEENLNFKRLEKQFAEKKGKGGDYSTPSDYIRSLIRKDKEEAWARLESMLIEGLNSGEAIVDSKESRELLRKEARRRLAEHGNSMPTKKQA